MDGRCWLTLALLLALPVAGCTSGGDKPAVATAQVRPAAEPEAPGFEVPPSLHAGDLLPPGLRDGANFTLADAVRSDGFLNYYTLQVREPAASLDVAGTELLRERVAELGAVAKMSQAKTSSTFTEAAKKAAVGPFRFARNLITAPSATLASTASGVSSYAGNLGHALFGSTGAGEEGALKTAIGFASAKRAYAYGYGVDPYSTNPVLQKELEDIAWAGFAGGTAVGLGLGALPGIAGEAASVTGLSNRLSRSLRDSAPAELAADNARRLKAMGVSDTAAKALAENVSYTPTYRTRLVAALEQLQGVNGRDLLVQWAAVAARPEIAYLMARHAEMLAAYHQKVQPLARFERWGSQARPVTRSGETVIAFPLDQVFWTERFAALVGDGPAQAKSFWITGRFSPLPASRLQAAGWSLHEEAGAALGLE